MIAGIAVSVAVLAGLALGAGGLLAWLNHRWPRDTNAEIDAVDSLLPQTQCAQCGYPGCRPYAQALVNESAPITLCPPGGEKLVEQLAEHLGRSADEALTDAPAIKALIDETRCIGCLLCIQACPVDAIVGARGYMHTVLVDECTGCELCLPPCPVDCIELIPAPVSSKP